MSTEIREETEPLTHTIKLYNTTKFVALPFPIQRTINDLKRASLLMTSWFPEYLSPSELVLYEEGTEGTIGEW